MKHILFAIAVILIFFLAPTSALAQEKINSFDTVITAHQDGSMTVVENISYDFGSNDRHGIFRDIPLVSRVGDLYRVIKLEFDEISRDNAHEKYQINSGAQQTQVKIGDPDKTISWVHNYTIIYKVLNGIGSNYEDHDEIYWNVTGNGWEVPIEKASVIIKTDFGVVPEKTICFTGFAGTKESDCQIEELSDSKKVVTKSALDPREGFTLVSSFPVNTFPKSVLQKSPPKVSAGFLNLLKLYGIFVLVLNLLLAPYLIYWYHKNKSKVRFGPPSVNFDIPKNNGKLIAPAEAGIIDNTKLEKDDVVATIFDLAIRKYIRIEEVKENKKFRPDEINYKIIKLKAYSDTNTFEKELLNSFFNGEDGVSAKVNSGDIVMLKDLKLDFYKTFEAMETEVFQELKNKGIYTKNPKIQIWGLLALGIVAMGTLNLILGGVLVFLSRKLNGRTQLGDKIDWQVDGLKIFLKAMSRHYKFQAKNLITVEKYIPYAIALGLQDEFMQQLKIIYPDYKPSWYSGSHNFYSFYPGLSYSMNSNFTTSAPSSSSGFSGGSSGGGGGGGGGGSW